MDQEQKLRMAMDARIGAPTGDLTQINRGDSAVIRMNPNDPNTGLPVPGAPTLQPVWKYNWEDRQARMVTIDLAPIEISDPTQPAVLAFIPSTGPVQGNLTWGIEGGATNRIDFDWGSAVLIGQVPFGEAFPDGRMQGLQISFVASYVELQARNWMNTVPSFTGFGTFGGIFSPEPRDARVRAFMTVGAPAQRRTPVTMTFFDPCVTLGANQVQVPPKAKRVKILRFPTATTAMSVQLHGPLPFLGNTIDEVSVALGTQCPWIDLTPDTVIVSYVTAPAIVPGPPDFGQIRVIFELAI